MKSLVDKSSFESISDDCPHLSNFCIIMEHILSHRLQGNLVYPAYIFEGSYNHSTLGTSFPVGVCWL